MCQSQLPNQDGHPLPVPAAGPLVLGVQKVLYSEVFELMKSLPMHIGLQLSLLLGK